MIRRRAAAVRSKWDSETEYKRLRGTPK
jgi:hypothetical protein